jgi:hypothetical protein
LILLVDRDLAKAIKETGYRIFTGLVKGTFKALSNPGEDMQWDRQAPTGPASPAAGVEEGGTDIDTPSEILVTVTEGVGWQKHWGPLNP